MKKVKRIKILKIPEFLTTVFDIKVGDKFTVIRNQYNEDTPSRMSYLIYTKKKKAIVVYNSEVEVM